MKIKNYIQRDKCCIVRCGLAMTIVVILVFSAIMYHVIQEEENGKIQRASEALQRATQRFEQFMLDASAQLKNTATLTDALQKSEDEVFAGLVEGGVFDEVWIDGQISNKENVSAISVRVDENRIVLNTGVNDGMLCAGVAMEQLSESLSNALQEKYSYVLYNVETGSYLVNTTCFNDGGYYDALLNLNRSGEVQELTSSDDAEFYILRCNDGEKNYYITQNETAIDPLGISMVIPETSLIENFATGININIVLVGSMAVLLVCVVVSVLLMLRRVRREERMNACKQDTVDGLMRFAVHDSGIAMLICTQNAISACYDGMNLLCGNQNITSFADLERICGMDDGEIERVYHCMGELEQKSISEITVRCFDANREERTLRMVFRSIFGEEKQIACTIFDCTQQQESEDRTQMEDRLLEGVKHKASSICQINISRNRWRVLYSKASENMRSFGVGIEEWHDYTAYLTGQLREYIHPADYDQFVEEMCIPGVAASFRAGKDDFIRDYRIKSVRSGSFEWHRFRTRIWLDAKSNDIIANLCIFNVDAKKNAELERGERKRILHQSLTALGGIYNGLYYVDLENNLAYTARSAGGELSSQLCVPYKETFDAYIADHVHPEDRDAMQRMLSAYFIRRNMTEGSHFQQMVYHRKIDEEGYGEAVIIIQPARFENGTVREVVLAMRNIQK